MPVDTPAAIAVLGAGPIGLEAAIYGRYLGYDVQVYERSRVAENVLRWGHVTMFSPLAMNCSKLGLAALAAQDETFGPGEAAELVTGRQWAERYLLPLAQSDLLADQVHEHTTVVAVGRDGPLKGDLLGDERREEFPFRLLLRDKQGGEQIARADVVIDTTGVFGNHNWLGRGGIPAMGELQLQERINYGLPDVAGEDRHRFVGKHTLLVGGGYSAATNVVALAELAAVEPDTRVTWITRREPLPDNGGPLVRISDDRLPARDELARRANALAAADVGPVAHLSETNVEAIAFRADTSQFDVRLSGKHEGPLTCDAIIANVGYRPDNSLYAELQVHECYASGGPMKLAAALLGETSADCLDQTPAGAAALANPEPNFYILGSKSYGRNSKFLYAHGLQQVRDAFTLIVGRENLDLYATM